jgi:Ca-activated chloride channel family protein
MRIGDRFIEGQIKEKKAAKIAYETAKSEGKKASLIEQRKAEPFHQYDRQYWSGRNYHRPD